MIDCILCENTNPKRKKEFMEKKYYGIYINNLPFYPEQLAMIPDYDTNC